MAVAFEQNIGSRSAQEDALTVIYEREGDASGDLMMLVADGMGGHVGGATASNLVIKTFREAFLSQAPTRAPKERVQEALSQANAALRKETANNPALNGMGTTLIAAWKHGDGLLWLSVGDSPLYLYRAGQLRRLNVDHSFFGELMEKVQQGRITLAEAKAHPKRNALRSALTGNDIRLVDINNIGLQINDTLIVASDGLDTLEEKALCQVIEAYHRASPGAMCQKLISATLECGNPKQDNISVITYIHGAQDRTSMKSSDWTQLSFANRMVANWQVAALSFIGVLLIVSIAVMIALKMMPSEDVLTPIPVPAPVTEEQPQTDLGAGENTQAPEEDAPAVNEEEPASTETAPLEETPSQETPTDNLPDADPATSGVAATLQESEEASDE